MFHTTAVDSIRLAVEDDLRHIMQLVRACIMEMQKAGIDQWDDFYPTDGTVMANVRARTLYLGFLDKEHLVGTLVLDDYQNPEYAHVQWTTSGLRVAVVHRLMVDPPYQGKGIARELMRFAEEQARELGYGAIRLDAFSANPRALQLYQGLGYHHVGYVTFRKGVFECFEKALERA